MKQKTKDAIKVGDVVYFTCPTDLTKGILYTVMQVEKIGKVLYFTWDGDRSIPVRSYMKMNLHKTRQKALEFSRALLESHYSEQFTAEFLRDQIDNELKFINGEN